MEYEGVKVDEAFLAKYSEELQSDLILLRASIWEMAGQEFNIDSPKQLGEILFDKLKLPGAEKLKRDNLQRAKKSSVNSKRNIRLQLNCSIIAKLPS